MSKELWMQNYNREIENLCEEKGCDVDKAEKILDAKQEADASYLHNSLYDHLTDLADYYHDAAKYE